MTVVDPKNWLVTSFRALKEYIIEGIDASVRVGNTNKGLEIYEVVFDFDPADTPQRLLPFKKTLIHFSIDAIDNKLLGFGDSIVEIDVNESTGKVIEIEATEHTLNFDVGVYASAESGGSTARLKAWQALTELLHGPKAQTALAEATQGVIVQAFRNGRFVADKINDIPIFRIVGGELIVMVFGTVENTPASLVDEIELEPGIDISDEVIV